MHVCAHVFLFLSVLEAHECLELVVKPSVFALFIIDLNDYAQLNELSVSFIKVHFTARIFAQAF